MMPVHPRMLGLVHTYGVLAASEGSPLTERLQSEIPATWNARPIVLTVWVRFVNVPLVALSRKPKTLSHVEAASMTLPWLCAWITVDTLASVKEGDNVVIIGM